MLSARMVSFRHVLHALALVVVFGACARERKAPFPAASHPSAPVIEAELGRALPIYQSGTRLKIRWAEPVGAQPGVRVVHAIFDTMLGRECALTDGEPGQPCLPVADKIADTQDVAFLDSTLKSPVLVVDALACVAPGTTSDTTMWQLPPLASVVPDPLGNRFYLEAAHRVSAAWTVEGPGCVMHYEPRRGPLCVRGFRPADLGDVVRMKETILGRDGGGVVVAVGSDGSVLPLAAGADYQDAQNALRCEITPEDESCLPRKHDTMMSEPVAGADVSAFTSWPGGSTWAVSYEGQAWAMLSPLDNAGGSMQPRKVLSLLPDQAVIRFPTRLIEPTARIGLHLRTMPDGRGVPVSLFDTQLKRDCVAMRTDDGAWRCAVKLPMSCQESSLLEDGEQKQVLSPSSSFCKKPETCCKGGTLWFPAIEARDQRRYGDESGPRAAVPGRAVRFSEIPRTADHLGMWQPEIRALVYEKIEDLKADAFAPLRIVQDP